MPTTATKTYTGASIQVLEGLDPVRKRPGMYIGGTGKTGLHHLVWEIVDNAVDEATNGYASLIEVTLHKDGRSVTVEDNGRGIPVDKHPVKKIPTLEVILTTLHAGGKFDGSNYITSGGLHGVGASVVNALSEELIARIKRDGALYEQRYARGVPITKLKKIRSGVRGTGTTITFRPDTEIFDKTDLDAERIKQGLDVKAYLNGALRIVFKDEAKGEKVEFHHEGGIVEYLDHLIAEAGTRRIQDDPFIVRQEKIVDGARMEIIFLWTEAPKERIVSFVNGIPTRDGGTHEQGLKDGVTKAVRNYIETHEIGRKKLEITADDIREGMVAILNLYLTEPQFQGQTKEKLNNPEMRSFVSGAFRVEFERFLNGRPTIAESIVARIIQAAKARQASRAAVQQVRRKSAVSHRLNLPGKLADCSSTDPSESELFIVEGDSAGGSAKQGRDRRTQAILPLRGKVLNAEQATRQKVLDNKELSNIVDALGCGLGEDLDLSKLRYHKVILLMDADSDGHHIATLLLTFFYRYLKPLIDGGYVYLAQPPLFRLDALKETYWALDEADRERIEKQIKKKNPRANIEMQRFKGLGEMMPKTLKETTLDPEKRRLLRVTIPDDAKVETEMTISDLMGKDAAPRYAFIMDHAADVDELDV
ncbi:MAG: DNA gyrase subunit B [Bacteroidetes bacterium]|nr:DNA gyrase subunit B [Bacteroidota bacterium]